MLQCKRGNSIHSVSHLILVSQYMLDPYTYLTWYGGNLNRMLRKMRILQCHDLYVSLNMGPNLTKCNRGGETNSKECLVLNLKSKHYSANLFEFLQCTSINVNS